MLVVISDNHMDQSFQVITISLFVDKAFQQNYVQTKCTTGRVTANDPVC